MNLQGDFIFLAIYQMTFAKILNQYTSVSPTISSTPTFCYIFVLLLKCSYPSMAYTCLLDDAGKSRPKRKTPYQAKNFPLKRLLHAIPFKKTRKSKRKIKMAWLCAMIGIMSYPKKREESFDRHMWRWGKLHIHFLFLGMHSCLTALTGSILNFDVNINLFMFVWNLLWRKFFLSMIV